jgi:type II restriction enzyme
MDTRVAGRYKSASQIARVVSENWASRNLYCPSCNNDNLFQAPNNTKAYDFCCDFCRCFFQLKSINRWNEKQIPDAGYESMVQAIRSNNTPNLFILQYSEMWTVQNLVLVPSFFFSVSAIQKRNPLGPTARRAGWIGCNILLFNIANSGKIKMGLD